MANLFPNTLSIKVKLKVTPMYTITGIKHLYALFDMAYGEWLIFENNRPRYYLNIFDKDYEKVKERIGGNIEEYLNDKIKKLGKEWSLTPRLFGIRSAKEYEESVTIEKLPKDVLA